MWMAWQTDANPQHIVLWMKVRRKKRGFLGKSRTLLVGYNYQLPLFCFLELVHSKRCTFPLVCWVPLLLLDPCCLWANTQINKKRRELCALPGQCLHGSGLAVEDAGRKADTAVSWEANLCEKPFPDRETSVGSSACAALTCTVHVEKTVKTVL